MTDVLETKQLLITFVRLGKLAAKLLSDGVDISDAVAVIKALSDEEFRKCLADGFSGLESIPAELKDIDGAEAVALIGLLYAELTRK